MTLTLILTLILGADPHGEADLSPDPGATRESALRHPLGGGSHRREFEARAAGEPEGGTEDLTHHQG